LNESSLYNKKRKSIQTGVLKIKILRWDILVKCMFMQTEWSFCPDCQRVSQFNIDLEEESCITCGSVFEIENRLDYYSEEAVVS
jgi:hypothetical protein